MQYLPFISLSVRRGTIKPIKKGEGGRTSCSNAFFEIISLYGSTRPIFFTSGKNKKIY